LALFFQAGNRAAPSPAASAPVKGELGSSIPLTLQNWSSRDLPLGANELARSAAKEILQYDDFIYREFTRGSRRFSVYIAHWLPGKMPTRLVSIHTPDRCWTENGWLCADQKFNFEFDAKLPPAQWRIFTPPNDITKEFVMFWLFVAGKPYDFGHRMNVVPNPFIWWENVVREAVAQNPEQVFVRLSANCDFDELKGDPGFQEILRALGKLGLAEG